MATRITVVGTGYVGLTTGACLSHLGHDVTCLDVDEAKVAMLSDGHVPILEEGLDRLVEEGLGTGRLRFTTSPRDAVAEAQIVFLCLPTPQGDDGSADLSFVMGACEELGSLLAPGAIVINKSTVPVGTTVWVSDALGRSDVHVVSNPEFLRQGTAVHDFLNPDRVVIGSDDHDVALRVGSLYLGLAAPWVVTDPASAELIKYVANSFLATKLSFVNAIAAISESVGADISDVVRGVGYDKRIGHDFMKPGPGWGGSCLPKDTRALVRIADNAGYDFDLLQQTIDVNESQFARIVDKVEDVCGGNLGGKTVSAWGLTFKAGTDDLRDSPALRVIELLLERGARVRAYDPALKPHLNIADGVEVVSDLYESCRGADALLVLTEWGEFRRADLDLVAEELNELAVVDSRNMLDLKALKRRGFEVRAVGRT